MRDRKSDAHRKIAEAKVGRKLGPNEVVHHADENKENNADSNLAVQPRSRHTSDHNKTRHVSRLRASLRMATRREKLY